MLREPSDRSAEGPSLLKDALGLLALALAIIFLPPLIAMLL